MSMDDNINLPGTSASFNQLSDIIPKNIKTLNFLGMKLFYASTIATIAGRKIKVIFDTGLETSVLPLDFFIKYGFRIKPDETVFNHADGSKQENRGIAESLCTDIFNRTCDLDYAILDRNEKTLIGVD